MKLYTRTGDDGTTGLFGGDRVRKDHPRVAAYGDVDELNAMIGFAAAALSNADDRELCSLLQEQLQHIQSRLFEIGADLATPSGSRHEAKIQRIEERHVAELEAWIDRVDSRNSEMTNFVLPGGSELASRLHIARTVCRRAERSIISLDETEPVTQHIIVFVNRLSDYLFAAARAANADAGVADVPWIPRGP